MKLTKMLFVLLFSAVAFAAQAQIDAIGKYFEKYMDDEQFTTVYISGRMFSMVSNLSEEDMDDEVKSLLAGLKGLRILTTEVDPQKYYKEFRSILNTKEYEPLMVVRDQGVEEVQFLIKEEGDKIQELLLLVGGTDDFVLMSFVGDIDLSTISKLSESFDVPGMEKLEKLEENKEKEGGK